MKQDLFVYSLKNKRVYDVYFCASMIMIGFGDSIEYTSKYETKKVTEFDLHIQCDLSLITKKGTYSKFDIRKNVNAISKYLLANQIYVIDIKIKHLANLEIFLSDGSVIRLKKQKHIEQWRLIQYKQKSTIHLVCYYSNKVFE